MRISWPRRYSQSFTRNGVMEEASAGLPAAPEMDLLRPPDPWPKVLTTLLVALVCSLLAAAICVSGYLLLLSPIREIRPEADPYALDAETLAVHPFGYRLVRGAPGDTPSSIGALAPDGKALIVMLPQGLDADRFVFFDYAIAGRNPNLKLTLFWRQESNPAKFESAELPWTGGERFNFFLAKVPHWNGPVKDLALQIAGDLEGSQLRIDRLDFAGYSVPALLRSITDEWLALFRWDMKSINHLTGVPPNPILYQTPFVAASCLGALFLFTLSLRIRAKRPILAPRTGIIAIVLLHWLAGDGIWLRTQLFQQERSLGEYADKEPDEKALNGSDRKLRAFVAEIKGRLPPTPARIFILHNSEGNNFTRLRVQYLLIPHNIYNFERYPKKKSTRAGDYILAIQEIPDLRYDAQAGRIAWQNDPGMPATRLYASPIGSLYRVND